MSHCTDRKPMLTSKVKPGLHLTFFTPFKNELNEFPKCYSHMTSKYVKKIKGAAGKNGAKNGTCKRSPNSTVQLAVNEYQPKKLLNQTHYQNTLQNRK